MWIEARREAQLGFDLLEEGAFVAGHDLHPNAKDAALSIQRDSPAGLEGSGLMKLCCAAGWHANPPNFNRPNFEVTADDPIKFFVILPSPLAARVASWILEPSSVLPARRRRATRKGG